MSNITAMDTAKINEIVRDVDAGRVVFFGPEWGVVVLTVEKGEIIRVNSSWGDGPSEIERLKSWGNVRFIVQKDDVSVKDKKPLLGVNDFKSEDLITAPVLPSGYGKNLERVFKTVFKHHSPEEWMNIKDIIDRLSHDKRFYLIVADSGQGHLARILIHNRMFLGGIYQTPEDTYYNVPALKNLYQDNALVPLDVQIRVSDAPSMAVGSVVLPFRRKPSFSNAWKDAVEVARIMKIYAFCLLAGQDFLVGRGPDGKVYDLIEETEVKDLVKYRPPGDETLLYISVLTTKEIK